MPQTMGFVGPDGNFRELTQAYQQACDFAFQKVSTGAQDYISAVRETVQNLKKKGIRTIDYETGIHTSLEAAVRRNIMGSMGIMQEQISQQNHDDLVVTHDLRVFKYTGPTVKTTATAIDIVIDKHTRLVYTDDEKRQAFASAMKELEGRFGITWKEI